MSIRNLEYLFSPKAIAVIGIGSRADAVGRVVLENILAGSFRGPIYPVKPGVTSICGIPAYENVSALPTAPDLAVIATPPDAVAGLVTESSAKGCKAAIILTAGFGEGGAGAGLDRRQGLLDAARPSLFRILGPNCFGLMVPACGLNATFARTAAVRGHLALVAQSGALAATILDWAAPRNIGFSKIVTLGDMIDVDFGDVLDYLSSDPDTRAIVLYIEGVTFARKFMSAARAAARIKPVIVVKGGRNAAGAKAAASHTGALAGSDAVYDAAFARAGMLRVKELGDLFAAAAILTSAAIPKGKRLAIITNGGGFGVLATDALLDAGGDLAQLSEDTARKLDAVLPPTWSRGNPVDIIGDANGTRYAAAIEAVTADPGVDATLVMLCPTKVVDPIEVADAVVKSVPPERHTVLTAWLGDASVTSSRTLFTRNHIPTFESYSDAVSAFMNLVNYRERREQLLQSPSASSYEAPEVISSVCKMISGGPDRGWLGAQDVKKILTLYGIVCNRTVFAKDADEAAEIAESWRTPVALKIQSPDIIHKSDVGGVALNLEGAGSVKAEAAAMLRRITRLAPAARVSGFIVEEMIQRKSSIELFLGATVDPTFGPVIAFGHGGTSVEVVNDKALGLPPLNMALAHAMIAKTRVAKLLAGYRDHPPMKIERMAQGLVSLSRLIINHPEIVDVDINPMLADKDGVMVVDARIKIDRTSARPQLAVVPYPRDLERSLSLPGGESIFIRPIRPEDEGLLQAFVKCLEPKDVRFRFFVPLHELGHPMAARLTQIDYDREMALLSFSGDRDNDEVWGIARMFADPDNRDAEFALVIRSDRQGQGVGVAMMEYLAGIARTRGLATLWGDVLNDNDRMLQLCEYFGMKREDSPHGPGVVRVRYLL